MSHDAAPFCVAGVDGGGTSTRVLLMSQTRQVLSEGISGPGNPLDVLEHGVAKHLREALQSALKAASLPDSAVGACVLGYAGVGTEVGRKRVLSALHVLPEQLRARTELVTDLRVAHAGGLDGGPGIIMIAGTGSSTYGRNERGDEARAGGHGSFLDDMGSATDLGRRAAQAVLRASDGRGPPTVLTTALLAHLQIENETALPAVLGARGEERKRTAELAPLVTAAAELGDSVALEILRDAAEALAPSALAVATKLSLKNPTIVAMGGLVEASALYREILHAACLRLLKGATLRAPLHSSAFGAALLALRLLPVAP